MQSFTFSLLAISGQILSTYAAPAPLLGLPGTPTIDLFPKESNALPDNVGLFTDFINGVSDVLPSSLPITPAKLLALDHLRGAHPTSHPTSPEDFNSKLRDIYLSEPKPSSVVAAVTEIVEAGLTTDNIASVINYVDGLVDGDDSINNFNPRNPRNPIYPFAARGDAPYDLSEAALRAAIHIPETFKYGAPGAPQPVILVPGTGNRGYETFAGNYIKLLTGSDIADPVWLNIPLHLYGDTQTNAEYIAYAINYISGISACREIAVLGWSQGNIDTQWAFKYWPSTRSVVTDHIAFSPDYHGTVLANLIATPGEPLPPSVLQQEYNSNFITTLRANGGDSAYVPTTTIYSGFFDEIVEPQQGTGASAYLLDARNVGVSNNEVQTVCNGYPLGAGGFFLHEGTLYNNLGFALAVDALRHAGPGRADRLNLPEVCALPITQGLDIADVLITENAIAIAAFFLLTYPFSVFVEPPIKAYAQLNAPQHPAPYKPLNLADAIKSILKRWIS